MFATVNGVRLYYESTGSGPPLIAVHGGPGLADHREYVPWLEPLTDTYQVVTYDLRGCGQSEDPPSGTYSHADFVEDLDALRAHLGFERLALLGTSYGGFISQEYALRHPERLTHLILQDTAATMRSEDESESAAATPVPGLSPETMQRLFAGQVRDDEELRQVWKAMLPLYRATPDPEADAREWAATIFRYRAHNYAFAHNVPNFDLGDRLGEIDLPTLVICGRKDWITPPPRSEFIAARIPNARLVIFENSGHQPMIEETDGFLALVRDFLSS